MSTWQHENHTAPRTPTYDELTAQSTWLEHRAPDLYSAYDRFTPCTLEHGLKMIEEDHQRHGMDGDVAVRIVRERHKLLDLDERRCWVVYGNLGGVGSMVHLYGVPKHEHYVAALTVRVW